MKRKLLFFIFLMIVAGLGVGGMSILGNRSPKSGVLKVNSSPAVSIFLDNKHIGRNPYEDKISAGEYTIKLIPESTLPAVSSWQGTIRIAPNLLTYVNANLAESEFTSAIDVLWLEKISSTQSEISVTTNPDGATVLLDNETKGTTPQNIVRVSQGDHTLTVASPGFIPRTLKVKTTAGYKLVASLKLALAPGTASITEATASPTIQPTISGTPKLQPTPTKVSSSSATRPDPAKPFVIIKDTPTGYLRVRMEPSTVASEAARVNPGEKYSVLDTKSGWYEISYDGTNNGWVSGQYVEKVE